MMEVQTKRHRNIPIFIPHLGCPHQCVFCNQNAISGRCGFREEDVKSQIEAALSTVPANAETEIAFFGGSFTGIDRGLMLRLLTLAQSYVDKGKADSIRLSTRPDFINPEILEILSAFSVKNIELGLQSMSDTVLNACQRGHDANTARKACKAVLNAGFSLVGQMMIGLPGATSEEEIATAKEIVNLGACAVRIYPTVVFEHTALERMWRAGSYQPLSVEEAVKRSAKVLRIFEDAKLQILRIGLCASEELTSPKYAVAGPNHPALGELVRSEVYFEKILDRLKEQRLLGKAVLLQVPQGEASIAVGQRQFNRLRLEKEYNTKFVKVQEIPNLREFLILPQ